MNCLAVHMHNVTQRHYYKPFPYTLIFWYHFLPVALHVLQIIMLYPFNETEKRSISFEGRKWFSTLEYRTFYLNLHVTKYAIFVSAGVSYVQRHLRQHTETMAACGCALFTLYDRCRKKTNVLLRRRNTLKFLFLEVIRRNIAYWMTVFICISQRCLYS